MVDNQSIGQALSLLETLTPPSSDPESSLTLQLDDPTPVTRSNSLNEVIDSDLSITNNVLKALHVGWSHVKSISSLCKMADTTLNTLEKRRKLLNLQYGAEVKFSKTSIVYPMD